MYNVTIFKDDSKFSYKESYACLFLHKDLNTV